MKISVIIPMYNAEKFIGACLDSLIAQTFQDFEVIVVDDCSTDKSVEIVESYAEKFGGRLKFASTEKNSGGGGYIPRNIGLTLANGEYIYFIDADDFIVETALEIFCLAAKNYDADVIYTSAYYSYGDDENFYLVTDAESAFLKKNGKEDKPKVTRDNPNENLQKLFLSGGTLHMPWAKFVEKRLLIENQIEFPKIISGGDFIWTIQVLYFAKKLLRLPISLYFYRENAINSVTRKKRTPQEQISTCVSAFRLGAQALRDLSGKIELLAKNPEYFRAALMPFFLNCLGRTSNARMQFTSQEIYEILAREFPEDLIFAFMFSVTDEWQKISASKSKK